MNKYILTKISVLTFLLVNGLSFSAMAQSDDDLEVINLEDLYRSSAPPSQAPVSPYQSPAEGDFNNSVDSSTSEAQAAQPVLTQEEEIQIRELKDLNRLVPFSDVSVIQKKFLPKTERFEFYAGLGLTTNTPWFTNVGGKLNLSYNFSELFGLELSTLFLTKSERQVSKEIRENNNLKPEQFVYTKGFYGLDLKFSPVYGKIAWHNENIINYEMYFTVGGGISVTNSKEENVPTLHAGIGQIFALSKSMAFRWDYAFNFFQATPYNPSSPTTAEGKGTYQDFVLTAGISLFFPEASYR